MQKVLINNRGEIACRVIRAVKAEGYQAVAVFSEADADSPFVSMADEAIGLRGNTPQETYLDIDAVIEAARRSGADAIHPGYGFLSENAAFASACQAANITFIGPSPEAIDAMGNKGAAKRLMIAAGVPCIPGFEAAGASDPELLEAAGDVGFPLMVKAAAGGGGRGMRLVSDPLQLQAAITSARQESQSAFASSELILERAVLDARHIEVQIAADQHGQVIHLGERDCSVQRRHQKVIEEAPSPAVDEDLRGRMGQAAILAAKAVEYRGVGTVEFLVDEEGAFFFLEMNTRLQVEHPVTECVTGVDLVSLQLAIAEGEPLPIAQSEVRIEGHAIEVRIYAEDPSESFRPQTGEVLKYSPPSGEGIRVDSGIEEGVIISPFYDAMLSKVIAFGATREHARRRLVRALQDSKLLGIITNKAFVLQLLDHPVFASGAATTNLIDEALLADAAERAKPTSDNLALAAIALHAGHGPWANWSNAEAMLRREVFVSGDDQWLVRLRATEQGFDVLVGEDHFLVAVDQRGDDWLVYRMGGVQRSLAYALKDDVLTLDFGAKTLSLIRATYRPPQNIDAAGSGEILASTEGKVTNILVKVGDRVEKHQPLLVVEAMKMEHRHLADGDGEVIAIEVIEGQQVRNRQRLVKVMLSDDEEAQS